MAELVIPSARIPAHDVNMCNHLLDEPPERYKPTSRLTTTGQTSSPPGPTLLPPSPRPCEARQVFWFTHSRSATHTNGSVSALSRLGRYPDNWNHWAEKELKHIMGYVNHNVTNNLTFITYGNDVWEDVNIFIHSASSFASLRSDGRRLIVLGGRNGTHTQFSRGPSDKPQQRHRVETQMQQARIRICRTVGVLSGTATKDHWKNRQQLTPTGC